MTAEAVGTKTYRMILEDLHATLTYPQDEFLADLVMSARLLLQRTRIIMDVTTISVTAGQSVVTVPDEYMDVRAAFWNGSALTYTSGYHMDETSTQWEYAGITRPEYWREDRLAKNTIQILPTPSANGQLTLICTRQSSDSSLALSDSVDYIPDSVAEYLKWFVLEKVWRGEGENRDLNRAAYAKARCDELFAIADAIVKEDLLVGEP